jgi:DUF971 family protein
MQPTKIQIINKEVLLIKWDDDSESAIRLEKLRRVCPCATCLSEREKLGKKYIPIFNHDQIKVIKLKSVGSYAINIKWGDGHNTGIYEFSFLRKLTEINSGTV